MDTFTCGQCGRQFENKNLLKQFRVVKLGKDFCSSGCEKAYERDHAKKPKGSSSDSFSTGANAQPIIVEKGPSADEIIAEAKAEQMEYELSKKKKEDSALKPWMFDSNFSSADSISKISFPDSADDVEKTVLRIIKTAVDKIKNVVELSHAEFQQQTMGDQKAMWKPFYEEIKLVDTCIEKANEGIKKLRRFEGNAINAMMADCQDSLDDLKNKWYVKLIEKRDKKKKQTKIMIIVVIILFTAMMIALVANS
jgi:hypothetical protein